MNSYSFDVNVAIDYGVNAAIILRFFEHCCEYKKAINADCYSGTYWTMYSRRDLQEYFPYLSDKQIRQAIKKLIDGGLLIKRRFQKCEWISVAQKTI